MRVVVKIGTSTLAHATGHLNIRRVELLCKVLSDIKNAGHEVLLVSSGATGMGAGKLGLLSRPDDITTKQAAAAVGQCELMYVYDKQFGEHNHCVAQVLLTRSDVEDAERRQNLRNTFMRLLDFRVLPIINENDSVAPEEVLIGENESLPALVSSTVVAELVWLLCDIDGLFTADPRVDASAQLIERVDELSDEVLALAGGAGSSLGTGGMSTKLAAAQIAMDAGIDMIIANGQDPERLYDIIDGKSVGTRFVAPRA